MNRFLLEIRPLAQQDLALLDQHLPSASPAKHRARFERQAQGQVVYLVAWQAERPLGHVLLKWAGSTDEPVRSQLEACPDLEDLLVSEGARSQGIGSQLLAEAEELAKHHGYARLGLGVGLENQRARSLYERLGYQDSGLGVYRECGHFLDEHGQEHSWEEDCLYLVKQLL